MKGICHVADNGSASNSLLVSRERSANAIKAALRLYVGRGRHYSVKQLSNATGVKDRVIECAMTDPESIDWRPLPVEALLSIASFLGAEFTSEWLSLSVQGAFDLPDDGDLPPGQIAADSSEDATEIVKRAADGKFCANDRQALKFVGQRKIARGMRLVAMGKVAA